MRIYFCEPDESPVFDCPECGGSAVQTDGGTVCSNPDCPTNTGQY